MDPYPYLPAGGADAALLAGARTALEVAALANSQLRAALEVYARANAQLRAEAAEADYQRRLIERERENLQQLATDLDGERLRAERALADARAQIGGALSAALRACNAGLQSHDGAARSVDGSHDGDAYS